MKRSIFTTCLLPIAAVLIAASPIGQSPASIAAHNNDFAFELYEHIAQTKEGNVFFSPFSISTALAMTYAGAAGSTADEMGKVLHFPGNEPAFHQGYGAYLKALETAAAEHIELRIANRLWAEQDYVLKPEYLALNAEAYGSALEKMDFRYQHEASRIQINDWVADKTEDRIRDLIPENVIDPTTRLVLTNAIYFKGAWRDEFDEKLTRDRDFFLTDGSTQQKPFMHRRGQMNYLEQSGYQAIRLPYEGEQHSMVVLLPQKNQAIADIESQLNADFLERIFRSGSSDVNLALPKFKMTIPISLKNHLQALGMKEAFQPGANFSAMSPSNDLAISEVIHKAFIEIDEQGTEAAAATAVVMMETSSAYEEPRRPIIFVADRPFLFYIVDNATRSILFMGRVMEIES